MWQREWIYEKIHFALCYKRISAVKFSLFRWNSTVISLNSKIGILDVGSALGTTQNPLYLLQVVQFNENHFLF